MSQHLNDLIAVKTSGIETPAGISALISAGAIDILEKLKTYKDEELQKFIVEKNVESSNESIWTKSNAAAIHAWEIMGVKRSMTLAVDPGNTTPNRWRTAEKMSVQDKDDYANINSLKLIGNSYPGYIVESYSGNDSTEDGDNDALAESGDLNYVVTIFPQTTDPYFHSWKIFYIPIPIISEDGYGAFHSSYIPALAVYCAKNIVLGEMNRLLLRDEDIELAGELKNHYALLEQEYSSLMNIPPKKETNQ